MDVPQVESIAISAEVAEAIRWHGAEAYPRECCGVLVGRGASVLRAMPAENLAEMARQGDRYVVDPLAIVRADKTARAKGMDIVGFYHSHPDHPAIASATDTQAAWQVYVYIIVSVINGAAHDITAWRAAADGRTMRQLRLVVDP